MPRNPFATILATAAILVTFPIPRGFAQAPASPAAILAAPTYADLADLADHAPLVARVEVREAIRLKPEQAPGLRPGMARVLVKARTRALLVGESVGESVSYLAAVALDGCGTDDGCPCCGGARERHSFVSSVIARHTDTKGCHSAKCSSQER